MIIAARSITPAGPTARAASALGVDVSEIFVPMILPSILSADYARAAEEAAERLARKQPAAAAR